MKAFTTARALVCVAALSALSVAALRAASPEDDFRLMRRALVGPQTAYVPLPAETVCANFWDEVSVSPTATDALLTDSPLPPLRTMDDLLERETLRLSRLEQGLPTETQLLLWSSDSRRPMTVWRGGGSLRTGFSEVADVVWLPGTRVALITVLVTPPLTLAQREMIEGNQYNPAFEEVAYTLTIIRLNAGTGKTQILATGVDKGNYLLPSRTDAVAALIGIQSNVVQRIGPDGNFNPPFSVVEPDTKDHATYWLSWLPDGRTLRGAVSEIIGEGLPRKRTYYHLDTITGAMTVEKTPPAKWVRPTPVADTLPFGVRQETDTLTHGGEKTDVRPVWLEGRAPTTGRLLLAADSDADFAPVVLTGAVLYRKDGTVYAVPLLKSNAGRFLARRQQAQKQETLRRAKELGAAFLSYAEMNDGKLPPVGSNLGETLYLDANCLLENPATGEQGFTTAYKTPALAAVTTPATTPLGSLSGPGGVAVIYLDGHVQWEPVQSKP